MNDVIEAIHRRRSIRVYRPEPIDRALLEQLLWAAVQAPTPPVSGSTPWHLCVIEGAERLAACGVRAKEYARTHQPAGQRWEWAERPGFEVFWNAPAAVIFCARRGHPEAPFDCCRAAQTLLVAAQGLGLGSCWVGAPIPWLNSLDATRELALPASHEASAVVLVGYAAEQPAGQPRPRPDVQWC
jgi:nitroreductase